MLVTRYYLAFLNGDRREWNGKSPARPLSTSEDWMAHNQALVLARSGRMREARTLWTRAIAVAQQDGRREVAAIYEAAQAVCEAHFENACRGSGMGPIRAGSCKRPRCGVCGRVRAGAFRAIPPDRNAWPKIWQIDSRKIRPSSSSIFPPCARSPRFPERCPLEAIKTVGNGASLRSGDAGHCVLRQVRRAVYRLYARTGIFAGGPRPGGGGRVPKGPGSSRHHACRSGRRPGAFAIGESVRSLGRQGESQELLTRLS